MIISKKRNEIILLSFTISAILLISILGLGFPISTVSAQINKGEDIRVQIDKLNKQIQQLRAQIRVAQKAESVSIPATPAPISVDETAGYKFTRNLKVGDRGEDVRQLQIILNSDPATAVAKTGVGSTGNETTYFGFLTKMAVVAFQEKNVSEILTPLGLNVGTGYVGSSTRISLGKVGKVTPITSILPTIPKTSVIQPLAIQSDKLIVMYPSQYSGLVGTKLSLFGSGFNKNENYVVHFGDKYTVQSTTVLNSGTLKFIVPSDIIFGKYSIWVTSGKEKSNDDAFFIVTDPLIPEPTITSISPTSVRFGEKITISGSGFTPVGNNIRAGYEVIENVSSSDGETLTFKVKPPVFENEISSNTKFDFQAYVENKNGISNSANFSFSLAPKLYSIKSLFKTLKQFVIKPELVYAQGSGGFLSFGGTIKSVTYCTCSNNMLLSIGPPVGGLFVYQPGASVTYAYGQVYRSGPWTLGVYNSGAGACMMYVGVGCVRYPSIGMITMIGTSI